MFFFMGDDVGDEDGDYYPFCFFDDLFFGDPKSKQEEALSVNFCDKLVRNEIFLGDHHPSHKQNHDHRPCQSPETQGWLL